MEFPQETPLIHLHCLTTPRPPVLPTSPPSTYPPHQPTLPTLPPFPPMLDMPLHLLPHLCRSPSDKYHHFTVGGWMDRYTVRPS